VHDATADIRRSDAWTAPALLSEISVLAKLSGDNQGWIRSVTCPTMGCLFMIHHLFSCSHATCAIPEAHREFFESAKDEVESSAGWEPGVLNLGQAFAMHFRTPVVHGDVTRLLIDLEQDGDARWGVHSGKLPEATRQKLAERHEKPYRMLLHQRIADGLQRGGVLLHLMLHTGQDREGSIELETPQANPVAEEIASLWRNQLVADGLYALLQHQSGTSPLAAALARNHPVPEYAQIRLMVSQSFFLEGRPQKWDVVKKRLMQTLQSACAQYKALNGREDSSSAPG
jgi:hypothetical protein